MENCFSEYYPKRNYSILHVERRFKYIFESTRNFIWTTLDIIDMYNDVELQNSAAIIDRSTFLLFPANFSILTFMRLFKFSDQSVFFN